MMESKDLPGTWLALFKSVLSALTKMQNVVDLLVVIATERLVSVNVKLDGLEELVLVVMERMDLLGTNQASHQ
jgi:hypothetical protein